jgi:hypothetical protein
MTDAPALPAPAPAPAFDLASAPQAVPDPTRRALGAAGLGAAGLGAAGLLAAAGLAGLASPAAAEEPKKGEPVSNHVDLPSLVLPIAQDGRLITYLFVQARAHFADSRSADQIRSNQFFARDAVIRATARTHVAPGSGPRTFDAASVQRLIATAVASSMPNTRVARIELRSAEFMR